MKNYSIEAIETIRHEIRKTIRATHKTVRYDLPDGRYITTAAMPGGAYSVHFTDGDVASAVDTEQLFHLLNEQDSGLHRKWLASSDASRTMERDIHQRVAGGCDKLHKMADDLAAQDIGWDTAFRRLDSAARGLMLAWRSAKITPATAAALAELTKLDNPPLIQFVPSFGPEDISKVLDQWALDAPNNGIWECEGC